MAKRSGKSRSSDRGARGRLWRWRRPLFLIGLLGVLVLAGMAYLFAQVPLPDAEPPLLQTTFICDTSVSAGCTADNSIAQLSGSEDRVTVTYSQLPPVLINAVVAAEDRDFFDHRGVDPIGIARALVANIRNESVQQGGSTITQQYVKNVYLNQERTLTRKIKEAALAVKVHLRAAAPTVASAARAAAAIGWIAVVAGEYIGASAGLGLMITNAASSLATAVVIAGMIVIGLVGAGVSALIRWLVHARLDYL